MVLGIHIPHCTWESGSVVGLGSGSVVGLGRGRVVGLGSGSVVGLERGRGWGWRGEGRWRCKTVRTEGKRGGWEVRG